MQDLQLTPRKELNVMQGNLKLCTSDAGQPIMVAEGAFAAVTAPFRRPAGAAAAIEAVARGMVAFVDVIECRTCALLRL